MLQQNTFTMLIEPVNKENMKKLKIVLWGECHDMF